MTEGASEQGRGIRRMSSHAAAWLAWSLCAVTLALFVLSLLLVFLGWSTPLSRGWSPWRDQALSLVAFLGAPILGGLIASRRPENPYGWLWLGLGIGFALVTFAQVYAAYALVAAPGSLPAPRTVAVLGLSVGFVVTLIIAPFLFLMFPNGQLPSRRWRVLAWSIVAVGAVLVIVAPFLTEPTGQFTNPLGLGDALGETIGILFFGGSWCCTAPLFSQRSRSRSAIVTPASRSVSR